MLFSHTVIVVENLAIYNLQWRKKLDYFALTTIIWHSTEMNLKIKICYGYVQSLVNFVYTDRILTTASTVVHVVTTAATIIHEAIVSKVAVAVSSAAVRIVVEVIKTKTVTIKRRQIAFAVISAVVAVVSAAASPSKAIEGIAARVPVAFKIYWEI